MSRVNLVPKLKKPSTIHLQAAEEKQNGFCRYILTNKVTLFGPVVIQFVGYILKVKVVDIYGAAKRRGKYPPVFTSTSVNNC